MEVNRKIVKKNFTDSFAALEWLENDLDFANCEFGIAYIAIGVKTGHLTFGFDENDRSDDLYIHLPGSDPNFINLEEDYHSTPRGELSDQINRIIINQI